MRQFFAITLLLSLTIASNANALTLKDLVTPKAQKIALPCIAGIAAANLLGQEMGVGLAICAASATYVIVDDYHNPNQELMKFQMDEFIKNANKKLDTSLKENKEEYAIYQEAIRKIILEQLSEIHGTSGKEIEKYMTSPSFEAFLKEKTQAIMQASDDIVSDRLYKAKEEIRKQITEEVLKDVIDAQVAQ